MGNFRGNTYSRKHKKFNPNVPGDFWDFTIDDLALYDLPAMINYVLTQTGKRQLQYVGHSQGTTTPLMLLSTVPEFDHKIKSLNFLAPVMDFEHSTTPLIYPFIRNQQLLHALRCNEFLTNADALRIISETACGDKSALRSGCDFGLKAIMGNSVNQINEVSALNG